MAIENQDHFPTCGSCGSRMRQTYIVLTFAKGCERVPAALVCTNDECRRRQAEEDRADRAARDAAALEQALASGLIVPDDTPEEDRYAAD